MLQSQVHFFINIWMEWQDQFTKRWCNEPDQVIFWELT